MCWLFSELEKQREVQNGSMMLHLPNRINFSLNYYCFKKQTLLKNYITGLIDNDLSCLLLTWTNRYTIIVVRLLISLPAVTHLTTSLIFFKSSTSFKKIIAHSVLSRVRVLSFRATLRSPMLCKWIIFINSVFSFL